MGLVFLFGGAAASFNTAAATATCEACGMIVNKSDISAIRIVAYDGTEHWDCCPVCAEQLGIYCVNSTMHAKCYVSGREITVNIVNGNFSSVTVLPSQSGDSVAVVIGGGGCATNKIVSTSAYANQVRQTYSSNPNASVKTLEQTFTMARSKLSQMTLSYKPVEISSINYVLIGVGVAFLVLSPVAWKLGQKRNPNATLQGQSEKQSVANMAQSQPLK